MQSATVRDERGRRDALEREQRDRAPEQGDERHPVGAGQRLDGAKFDQPRRAAGRTVDVPEFVERNLAAVRVAGNIDVQVTQGFADERAMIFARFLRMEVPVSKVEIEEIARAFIRARRLRTGADVMSREEVSQTRVSLKIAQQGSHPGGPRKEGIFVETRAAE